MLERLYAAYNNRGEASPDPVEFLYRYEDPLDREIVALFASCLAYGRVAVIHRSVTWVLERFSSPRDDILRAHRSKATCLCEGFRHRFTSSDELAGLVGSIRDALQRYGSLRACFLDGLDPSDTTVVRALQSFVTTLNPTGSFTSLLPLPAKGSACKRLHLFLRWLVRHDAVDPGGWESISAARLIIPLDAHMFRLGRRMGLTTRSCATLATAREITEGFRAFRPDDPVRYDFALTRVGMRGGATEEALVDTWRAARA